jgi:3-oxoadipate enol-lactonase
MTSAMAIQRVNGIDIGYDAFGLMQTTPYPVLFLHDALTTRRMWANQFYTFAAKRYVLAPDLRGHGESGRSTGSYAVRMFADDMAEFLLSLGVDRAAVIGHGMGGMIALEMAITYPDQVGQLVLVETSPGVSSNLFGAWRALFRWWRLALTGPIAESKRMIAQQANGSAMLASTLQQQINPNLKDKENYLNIWRATVAFNAWQRLKYVECPTLLVYGAESQNIAAASRIIKRLKYGKQAVVAKAGMLPHLQNITTFNEIVMGFLKST